MPVITAIERARGRPAGFVLEVDGEARFRIPAELRRRRDLTPGLHLSVDELGALAREAGDLAALERAVRYLSHRSRTCREVRRHLAGRGLSLHADAAIERCLELGYLDDEAYARTFVRDRIRLKPRGRARLVSELGARGIDRAVAERAVEAVFAEERVSEPELMRREAERRLRSLGRVDAATARRRLRAYLIRRGFGSSGVRSVVDDLLPPGDGRRTP